MTSRFILNKFDLDLSPSRLLVGFGLFLILLVLCSAVHGILVVDERVICDGVWRGLCSGGVGFGRRGSGRVHIVGAGTLAHDGGRWGRGILGLVVLDGVGGERLRLGVGGVGGGRSGGHAAKRHAQRRRTESELRTLAGKGIEWEGEKGRLISLKPRCHLSPQTSAHRKLPYAVRPAGRARSQSIHVLSTRPRPPPARPGARPSTLHPGTSRPPGSPTGISAPMHQSSRRPMRIPPVATRSLRIRRHVPGPPTSLPLVPPLIHQPKRNHERIIGNTHKGVRGG